MAVRRSPEPMRFLGTPAALPAAVVWRAVGRAGLAESPDGVDATRMHQHYNEVLLTTTRPRRVRHETHQLSRPIAGRGLPALRGSEIIDLHDADPALPSCPKALLAQGPEAIGRAERALAAGRPVTAPGDVAAADSQPGEDHLHRLELCRSRPRDQGRGAALPGGLQQVPHRLVAARRNRPLAAGQRAGRLRSRVGAGDRPPRPLHSPSTRPAATSPPTPAETTSRPAIGSRTSPAGNGFPARVSTPSHPAAPGWSRPTRSPSRESWGSSCGSTGR